MTTSELIPVTVDGKQMWLIKEMVEKLTNHQCGVQNTGGSVEQLQVLMQEAFPEGDPVAGTGNFYNADLIFTGSWYGSDDSDDCLKGLVYYTISVFFAEPSQEVVIETGIRKLTADEGEQSMLAWGESEWQHQDYVHGYCAALSTLPAPLSELLAEREQMRKALEDFDKPELFSKLQQVLNKLEVGAARNLVVDVWNLLASETDKLQSAWASTARYSTPQP